MNERPFVVCHILSSLDGRIDGNFFSLPETMPVIREYGRIRAEYQCDANLYGTVTASEVLTDGLVANLTDSLPVSRADWIADHTEERIAVALDPKGTLNWRSGTSQRSGQAPAHAVAILSESVTDAYLTFLQRKGVSYLFAGQEEIDLMLAMEKLSRMFGIRRLMLSGGGVMDWSMLEANLIDEVSLCVAPAIEGTVGVATVFDCTSFSRTVGAQALTLKDVHRIAGDGLWLRYTVK